MLAETVYQIAIHLSDKEMEKLWVMLNKKVNTHSHAKTRKKQVLSDKEAIAYLLKHVFRK